MFSLLSKMAQTAQTWNEAKSNSTTGFERLGTCLDYFFKAGTYSQRAQAGVDADMVRIFADDEATALKIVFGTRLITRKPKGDGVEIENSQTGYGRKDEFQKAVVWLHTNKPDTLYENLHLIPVFGCWKDFLQEPLIDTLNRERVYALFAQNLDDQLLRKYLPQLRSGRKVRSERDRKRSDWAKGFCSHLGISPAEYRKLKSSGAAHIWQKQMARGQWDQIHFNGIPGKAMLLATSRKGKDKQTVFERHGQVERLKDWVLGVKTVKFTGYPYELLKAAKKQPTMIQKMIYDKQFDCCVESMKDHKLGNVLACLDISGSMTWCTVTPDGTTPYDICISMGIAFSSMNVGYFKDAVCAFSDTPIVEKLKGGFCDRFNQIENSSQIQQHGWGSTNFQGVIDLLCNIKKKNPEIPVSEFPDTLLVVSDMQFNPVGVGQYNGYNAPPLAQQAETNYEASRRKLTEAGLEDVRIIWWCVNGQPADFPSQMGDKGVYMIGGFDPSVLKSLMGLNSTEADEKKDFVAKEKVEETPLDGMLNFLSQPIFNLIKVKESVENTQEVQP
jgi:hypothetical protein